MDWSFMNNLLEMQRQIQLQQYQMKLERQQRRSDAYQTMLLNGVPLTEVFRSKIDEIKAGESKEDLGSTK